MLLGPQFSLSVSQVVLHALSTITNNWSNRDKNTVVSIEQTPRLWKRRTKEAFSRRWLYVKTWVKLQLLIEGALYTRGYTSVSLCGAAIISSAPGNLRSRCRTSSLPVKFRDATLLLFRAYGREMRPQNWRHGRRAVSVSPRI